jgi:hypothetical protein
MNNMVCKGRSDCPQGTQSVSGDSRIPDNNNVRSREIRRSS